MIAARSGVWAKTSERKAAKGFAADMQKARKMKRGLIAGRSPSPFAGKFEREVGEAN